MLELVAGAALRSLLLATAVGAGLRLRRRCNPHVSLTAWTLVLMASLSMPVAMRLTNIALPHHIIAVGQLPAAQKLLARIEASPVMSGAEPIVPDATLPAVGPHWRGVASGLYLAMVTALMLRLVAGLWLSWAIVRGATPIGEDWVGGFDVRTSPRINAPATFGSVILLPGDHAAWTPARRLAILAHEGAHVARRDFVIQLAAGINRAVFWFNPFSWWLRRRLSDLAEAASDDAAIARLNDRLGYAEILLEISGRVSRLPGAVLMARGAAVASRIERILSETPLPSGMSQRGRAMLAAGIFPFAVSLSFLTIRPAPVPQPPLSAEAPASPEIVADDGTGEGVKQPTSWPTPAMAAAIVPPPAAAPRTDVASLPASPAMAPPSRRSAAAVGKSPRPSPHPVTGNTRTASPSSTIRQPGRVANNQAVLDQSPGPDVARPVGPWYSANGPDATGGTTDENIQSPLFKRLQDETCWGTYSGVVAGVSPTRHWYPVQAHFYRGPGDTPWVTLYYVSEKLADLPVTISGGEIKFTNTYGALYTLLPSREILLPARYHRLIGSTKRPPGGTVDIACGASNHRS